MAGPLAAVLVVALAVVAATGSLPLRTTRSGSPSPPVANGSGLASSPRAPLTTASGRPAIPEGSLPGGSPPGGSATAPAAQPPSLWSTSSTGAGVGGGENGLVPTGRAIVPVTGLAGGLGLAGMGIGPREVAEAVGGRGGPYAALELVADQAAPILAALGLDPLPPAARVILAPDRAALVRDLARGRRPGFLPLDQVGPDVQALSWMGDSLFGVGRVPVTGWPLRAALDDGRPDATLGTLWTLVAAGDILLDRGVAVAIRTHRSGVAFPFDGGWATIVGHRCCSAFGWPLPLARREGRPGAVRAYLAGADLTLANFENPAPQRPRFHPAGTVFNADPAAIAGVVGAGLDYVSLGNNHAGDAGPAGIVETRRALLAAGLAVSGAGANLAEAQRPALLTVAGVTVAILSVDGVTSRDWATPRRPGTAPLTSAAVANQVRAARRAGANLVILWPHWGVEYRATPTAEQRRLAHAAIDAGVDLIIGNHPHWAGAQEVYRGRPIWYALGNFVFDQTWSEPTEEGITLELTFAGTRLVQAWLRPHLVLDGAQPNFLDPLGAGAVVLDQVRQASRGLGAWGAG
jgi:hypothetical protein